jgi:hypothetical protein
MRDEANPVVYAGGRRKYRLHQFLTDGAEAIIVMAAENQKGSDTLPIDTALLEWAEYWYPISWKGVLAGGIITAVGACATIAFLLLQWRTTSIREEQSEWRTSTLEMQTAQANAALGAAQADIAKANVQIAEAKKQTATLEKDTANARRGIVEANARALEAQAELARFKAPRSIAEADKPTLISALSKFAGTKVAIYVLGDGPEPNSLGASINGVLTQSRWDSLTWNWSGAGAAAGVIVLFKAGTEGEIGSACDALVTAFNSARIATSKEPWPGDWDHFGGMLNGPNPPAPTEAPIRIVIGTKPQ